LSSSILIRYTPPHSPHHQSGSCNPDQITAAQCPVERLFSFANAHHRLFVVGGWMCGSVNCVQQFMVGLGPSYVSKQHPNKQQNKKILSSNLRTTGIHSENLGFSQSALAQSGAIQVPKILRDDDIPKTHSPQPRPIPKPSSSPALDQCPMTVTLTLTLDP
jgi:hypothetical protein